MSSSFASISSSYLNSVENGLPPSFNHKLTKREHVTNTFFNSVTSGRKITTVQDNYSRRISEILEMPTPKRKLHPILPPIKCDSRPKAAFKTRTPIEQRQFLAKPVKRLSLSQMLQIPGRAFSPNKSMKPHDFKKRPKSKIKLKTNNVVPEISVLDKPKLGDLIVEDHVTRDSEIDNDEGIINIAHFKTIDKTPNAPIEDTNNSAKSTQKLPSISSASQPITSINSNSSTSLGESKRSVYMKSLCPCLVDFSSSSPTHSGRVGQMSRVKSPHGKMGTIRGSGSDGSLNAVSSRSSQEFDRKSFQSDSGSDKTTEDKDPHFKLKRNSTNKKQLSTEDNVHKKCDNHRKKIHLPRIYDQGQTSRQLQNSDYFDNRRFNLNIDTGASLDSPISRLTKNKLLKSNALANSKQNMNFNEIAK